ncbi:MAG: hypothetical protein ACTSUK_06865 [Promethearchaeota archaeon]
MKYIFNKPYLPEYAENGKTIMAGSTLIQVEKGKWQPISVDGEKYIYWFADKWMNDAFTTGLIEILKEETQMDPLTPEQKEYLNLKMVHHRIMTDWLEFEKSDESPNCIPKISDGRLTKINGKHFIIQGLVNEYMELLKDRRIVVLIHEIIEERNEKG